MNDYTSVCKEVVDSPEFKSLLIKTGGELISSAKQFINGTIVMGVKSENKAYTFDFLGQARESRYTEHYGGTNTLKWRVDAAANVIRKPDQENRSGKQPYLDAITAVKARFDKRESMFTKRCDKLNKDKKRQKLVLAYLFKDSRVQVGNGKGIWSKPYSMDIRSDAKFEDLVEFFGGSSFAKEYRVE